MAASVDRGSVVESENRRILMSRMGVDRRGMPGLSGLEASQRIRKLGLRVPVVIFTTHHSDRLSLEVQQAGAQRYVLKSQAARNLVLAIDTLLAGGTFFGAPPQTEERHDKPNPGILFCRGLAFAF